VEHGTFDLMSQPQRHYTLDDYFAVEETSVVKHEFMDGEIFAMAGASLEHNHIAANVLMLLRSALRETGCSAFGSDLRVATHGGLYTYPDVSVICGKPLLVTGRPDTATNPVLLIEVLSDATRDYDRGDKLVAYRVIPSLREVLLIDQASVAIESWRREGEMSWVASTTHDLAATMALAAVPVELPIREVYREVFA
jgi:Uma2 family endonuclease